jgi:hypothetical protein
MTNRNRILAILLAVAITFVMLFSVLFIAIESGHDCTGEECKICEQLSICVNTLKKISVTVITAAFIAVLLYSQRVCSVYSLAVNVPCTLVALKVKLSN